MSIVAPSQPVRVPKVKSGYFTFAASALEDATTLVKDGVSGKPIQFPKGSKILGFDLLPIAAETDATCTYKFQIVDASDSESNVIAKSAALNIDGAVGSGSGFIIAATASTALLAEKHMRVIIEAGAKGAAISEYAVRVHYI